MLLMFHPDNIRSEVRSNSFLKSYNIIPDLDVEQQQELLRPFVDGSDDLISERVVDPYDLFDNLRYQG
jgi:hypothetical protein